MIDYRCQECGEAMSSPDSLGGQVETCPHCGIPVRVPRARVSPRPPARAPSTPPGAPRPGWESRGPRHKWLRAFALPMAICLGVPGLAILTVVLHDELTRHKARVPYTAERAAREGKPNRAADEAKFRRFRELDALVYLTPAEAYELRHLKALLEKRYGPFALTDFFAGEDPATLFEKASPAVVTIRASGAAQSAQGSGFFIRKDGTLVTNYHVVRGATAAEVILAGKTKLPVARLLAVKPEWDLALLKVDSDGLPFLPLTFGPPPKVGARVYAIGSPRGLTNTLSEGLVSGLRKINEDFVAIQTTAPISPGSSGGPLLNAKGEVVGVTTFGLVGGQNPNFAIPAELVGKLLKSATKPIPLRRMTATSPPHW